jgi:hypothetical protein
LTFCTNKQSLIFEIFFYSAGEQFVIMRAMKGLVFIAAAVVSFASAPAMAAMANEVSDTRNNDEDEVRPAKKQKEAPAKNDAKQAPKKEACRSCRILM